MLTISPSPADRQLAALGDPSRRAIFEQLVEQPLSVGALAARFPISRPAVSQHLRVLKDARLVQHERIGTQNVYRVDPAGMVTLRKYLDAMWGRALGDFKSAAETSYRRTRKERP